MTYPTRQNKIRLFLQNNFLCDPEADICTIDPTLPSIRTKFDADLILPDFESLLSFSLSSKDPKL